MRFLSFQHQVVFASTSQPFLYLIEKTSLQGMPLVSLAFKFKVNAPRHFWHCLQHVLVDRAFLRSPGSPWIFAKHPLVPASAARPPRSSPCLRLWASSDAPRVPGAASGYLHPPLPGSACGHPSHPRMGARSVFANLEGACGVPSTCLSSPTDSLPGVLL